MTTSAPAPTPFIELILVNIDGGPMWITDLEITQGVLSHGQEKCKIIGTEIRSDSPFTLYARGKEFETLFMGAPQTHPTSGTEGKLTISSSKDALDAVITVVSWRSPLPETTNNGVEYTPNPVYFIEKSVYPDSGPIGQVTVTVQKNHIEDA